MHVCACASLAAGNQLKPFNRYDLIDLIEQIFVKNHNADTREVAIFRIFTRKPLGMLPRTRGQDTF